MRPYFTSRHKDVLESGQLEVDLPESLRNGLERILQDWSLEQPRGGRNATYEAAEDELTTYYGRPPRARHGEELKAAQLGDVIRTGPAPEAIDAIEAWFEAAPEEWRHGAESKVNTLLTIRASEWRFVNGMALRIDSDYLHQEIVAGALQLLEAAEAAGAHEEFQTAQQALQQGDYKKAVTEAHKSVESSMKFVLGQQSGNFGALLAAAVKSGLVPEYYREFHTHFQKLALGAVKERNQPGRGHGQGAKPKEVSRALAQFALHLSGTINVFLIERWLEVNEEDEEEEPSSDEQNSDAWELPF